MSTLTAERLTGIIVGFAAVGVLLTGWLVLSELFRGSTCPPLLGVPACYVVLAGYVAALVGAWSQPARNADVLFLAGAGLVTVVGLWFSLNELAGSLDCPTFEGLPMCYMSLLTGVTLLEVDQVRRRIT